MRNLYVRRAHVSTLSTLSSGGVAFTLNGQIGMTVYPGATAIVPGTAPNIPTVTGTAGDFGFIPQQGTAGPVTVARAWNDAVGAYTEAGGVATRTTTWAHFVASIGAGGFDFQAHNPATSASIVGV